MLNDIFIIANPRSRYGGENESIIRYLISNSNRDVTIDELKEKLKLTATKDLPKVIDNLNFTGELHRIYITKKQTS